MCTFMIKEYDLLKNQQITKEKIISFFENKCSDHCEKRILPKFISNNYNINNEVIGMNSIKE
ncbi:hypothetical protein PIROE2DRAFT_15866 [Piromyces sp. E2]|nr:hypothetical protein PIROE2DRAFT_15866 [Piromyces sp. E2]|eukprot:OUM58784.1 hypothetical protein PIROE2DRAFT_15866 [Piromyces sp. E2]